MPGKSHNTVREEERDPQGELPRTFVRRLLLVVAAVTFALWGNQPGSMGTVRGVVGEQRRAFEKETTDTL